MIWISITLPNHDGSPMRSGVHARQISLGTPYLSEPPKRAYRLLFVTGYLLIAFQAPLCKVLLLINLK